MADLSLSAPDLSVTLAGLELKNPLMSASGTFGHGLEMSGFVEPSAIGAWVSKTVTPVPRHGNPAPRIYETEAGFLNSIGLENRGVEDYEQNLLPSLIDRGATIITNIGGRSAEEFVEMAERLDGYEQISAFEVNLSCPNVEGGTLPFSTVPSTAESMMKMIRAVTNKPLFAKLSPNVTSIGDIAKAVEAGGADGITAVNTLLGMHVDWRTRKPGLAFVYGGYSGVGLKPVAMRCAWVCAKAVQIPIIGCGGISTVDDVLEFLVAGCSAVQIGTANFSNPALMAELPAQLEERLSEAGVASIRDLIGSIEDGS